MKNKVSAFDWSVCDEFDDDELFNEDDELYVKCRNTPSSAPTTAPSGKL